MNWTIHLQGLVEDDCLELEGSRNLALIMG